MLIVISSSHFVNIYQESYDFKQQKSSRTCLRGKQKVDRWLYYRDTKASPGIRHQEHTKVIKNQNQLPLLLSSVCSVSVKHFFEKYLQIGFFSLNENVATHKARTYILQIQPPKDVDFSLPTTNSQGISLCLDLRAHPQSYIVMNNEDKLKWLVRTALYFILQQIGKRDTSLPRKGIVKHKIPKVSVTILNFPKHFFM